MQKGTSLVLVCWACVLAAAVMDSQEAEGAEQASMAAGLVPNIPLHNTGGGLLSVLALVLGSSGRDKTVCTLLGGNRI